jgi:hypothetical protein
MKKIYSIVALLAVVLVSTSAMAVSANKELCLTTQSNNAAVTTQTTHILSYTALANGHVLIYGETCYIVPANPPIPEVKDCLPVSGSGILNEGKLEFSVQGAEYNNEYGFGAFTTGIFHMLLSIETLTGTYATESVTYYEVGDPPIQVEFFDSGTAAAIKCPAVSKSELEADKLFKKLVEQLDKLGNQPEPGL